jgi:signal transduction histidine kinase
MNHFYIFKNIALFFLLAMFAGTVQAQSKQALQYERDSMSILKELKRATALPYPLTDSAIRIFQFQLLKAKKLNIPNLAFMANFGLAARYNSISEYGIAYEILSDNVKHFDELVADGHIDTYCELINTSYWLHNYDNAILYGAKALALIKAYPREGKYDLNYVNVMLRLNLVYSKIGKFDSARYCLDICLANLDPSSPSYQPYYASYLNYEGFLYMRMGNIQKGVQNYLKAIDLYAKMGSGDWARSAIGVEIFKEYVDHHEYQNAKAYLPDPDSLGQKTLSELTALYPKIALFDSANGDFKGAYHFLNKTLAVRDSIDSKGAATRTAYYSNVVGLNEANYRVFKQEIAARNNRYLTLLIGIISLLLITMLLVFFRNRRLRTQLRHHQELKQIGNDLHDEINPILGYARMMLSRVDAEDSNDKELLQKSGKALEETMDNLRLLTRQLNMLNVDKAMYIDSIKEMVDKLCEAYGYTNKTEFSFDEKSVPETTKRNLFLVLQELVHNTMKYAEGDAIFIAIKTTGNELNITYADNGKGLEAYDKTPEEILPKIYRRIVQLGGKATFAQLNNYPGLCIFLTIPLRK